MGGAGSCSVRDVPGFCRCFVWELAFRNRVPGFDLHWAELYVTSGSLLMQSQPWLKPLPPLAPHSLQYKVRLRHQPMRQHIVATDFTIKVATLHCKHRSSDNDNSEHLQQTGRGCANQKAPARGLLALRPPIGTLHFNCSCGLSARNGPIDAAHTCTHTNTQLHLMRERNLSDLRTNIFVATLATQHQTFGKVRKTHSRSSSWVPGSAI